jgi:SAM-dependent methyltransferase
MAFTDSQSAVNTDIHSEEGRGVSQNVSVDGTEPPQGVGKEEIIYTSRFSAREEQVRNETWNVLVEEYFQPLIGSDKVVVDLGAGDGLFITKIKARTRYAVDLSPHVNKLKSHGVSVLQVPGTAFAEKLSEKADVVFMSNFLEHMPDKMVLLKVLEECKRALKPGGKVVILQPNIRYAGAQYWDYIDHHIALTEHSLREALEICGFKIEKIIPQFLPYTAKSSVGLISSLLPTRTLVSTYLKMPFLWRFFGAQTLAVARA